MDFYYENVGFEVKSTSEIFEELYNNAIAYSLYTGSLEDFKASNWHLLFNSSTLPFLEKAQANTSLAISSLFSYWQEQNMAINSSNGASFEGFINNFSSLCTNLVVKNYSDDPTLSPAGSVAIYFDNLNIDYDENNIITLNEKYVALQNAFLRSAWAGMICANGDLQVAVPFSNGATKTYTFNNLKPENYTPLLLSVEITYIKNSIRYDTTSIVSAIYNEFAKQNCIGKAFYPDSLLDLRHQFKNIASYKISSKLLDDTSYSYETRACNAKAKYIIEKTSDIIVSSVESDI